MHASLTFAVPDLHGRADLLDLALDAIAARAQAPATVVFLGDYVGKGGATCQVLERLIAGPGEGWRWIFLKGNHEAMMLAALGERLSFEAWLKKGGEAILRSYSGGDGPPAASIVPARHLDWLQKLSTMHVDTHRVFVHAGVDPSLPLDRQNERDLLWKRYEEGDGRGHGHRFVVHGHRPFAAGPMIFEGRVDLDTFAWSTGRLAIGVFDDDRPGGPIEIIEVGRSRAAVRWQRMGERIRRFFGRRR